MGLAFVFAAFLRSALATSAEETPRLSISPADSAVVVTWPDWATNWVLEESANLAPPAAWVRRSSTNTSLHVVPAATTNGFFRLRKIFPNIAGLSGHWQFDSVDGTPSTEGPVVSFTNATWSTGRVGPQSLHFDGAASGTKAWVSNSNHRVLPPSGQPFTVSMWFSPDALPLGSQGLMGNGNWSVSLQTTSPGTNNLVLSAPSLNLAARTLLVPREWHELTLTYDGSHGHIYLDGNLLARGAANIATDQQPIYFGGGIAGFNCFLGRIDEVRTYTNALTAEQLSVTGYWPFDENTGTAVHDTSIYGHHGHISEIMSFPGKVAQAIQVTGNAITIANNDFLVLPPTGTPFSISFWMLPRSLPPGHIGLMSFGEGTNSSWELGLEVLSGEKVIVLRSVAGIGTLNMRAPCDLQADAWSKVDVTFNGAVATLYLNGRKLLQDSGVIQSGPDRLRVGYVPGAASFDGLLDELKVYRRERGESEIGPVATVMWETVFRGSSTNFTLQGAGPAGKALTYSVLNTLVPTNGVVTQSGSSAMITYQAGLRKGPDAIIFTVSDGEFTSAPATLSLSVVEPHWLSPAGGSLQPLDGTSPERAWPVPSRAALDAIWRTNNCYDAFFYAPGVYETSGARFGTRPTAFPGCKHIGSGAQTTTLRLQGMWESTAEESMFKQTFATLADGFEIHNLLLDCNGNNNPKFTQGEPVLIRLPLTSTALVHSIGIRWNDRSTPGVGVPWRLGAASEFKVCARLPGPTGYITNCLNRVSTGQVDVVNLDAMCDEILIQLNRRAPGIEHYSIAEITIDGGNASLPAATQPSGAESWLDTNNPAYSPLRIVDQNFGTSWVSGPETDVRITVPTDPSTPISSLTLYWNCDTLPSGLVLGPAAGYRIRARTAAGEFQEIAFTRGIRTPDGTEPNVFAAPIKTHELVVELTSREPDVDVYSLRELSVFDGSQPLAFRTPSASSVLFTADFSVFQALDGAFETGWASSTRGMIGAVDVLGNNLKFTGLTVIGFGTTAGRECFPFFVGNTLVNRLVGNVLLEDCLFTAPATNNPIAEGITCVSVYGNAGSLTNSVVRRCTVRGLAGAFPLNSHALHGNNFEHCVVENCDQAVYFEPDFNIDNLGTVNIRSNRFLNVIQGVFLRFHPARQFSSINVLGNEIAILPYRLGAGFVSEDILSPGRSASITNVTLLGNLIRYSDWLPRPDNREHGILYSDMQSATFVNNLITLGSPSSLHVRHCPAGVPLVRPAPRRCPPHGPVDPPPAEDAPPCLNMLPSGYRRAWVNNRDVSGNVISVQFWNHGAYEPAFQQQPPPEIP